MARTKISRKRTSPVKNRRICRRKFDDSSVSDDKKNDVAVDINQAPSAASQVTPTRKKNVDYSEILKNIPQEQLLSFLAAQGANAVVPPATEDEAVTPVAKAVATTATTTMMMTTTTARSTARMTAAESAAKMPSVATAAASRGSDDDDDNNNDDTNMILAAREDMMEQNSALIGEYGGGMDPKILRRVKLCPEYVRRQSKMMEIVSTNLVARPLPNLFCLTFDFFSFFLSFARVPVLVLLKYGLIIKIILLIVLKFSIILHDKVAT